MRWLPEQAAPLSRWVRLADAVAIAALALSARAAAFGGFRFDIAGIGLSVTTWIRPLAFAAAILALRHAVCRRRPLHERLRRGVRRWGQDASVRAVFPIWAATRFGVLLVGILAMGAFGFREDTVPFRIYETEALNLPARFDAGWYLDVAADGYKWDPGSAGQQNIAFMPALPLLMRVGGRLLGGHPLWAGQIIVLAAGLWGFVYVHRLARAQLGDEARAATAVALQASYPFAVFYSAVYTEALYLLGAAGAFYYVARRQYWRVAAFAFLCGLVRPHGFLLALPLWLAAFWPALVESRSADDSGLGRRLVGALRASAPAALASGAAVAGVLLFSGYIAALTGRPFTWLEAHRAWGRVFGAWLSEGPIQEISYHGVCGYVLAQPIDALNLAAAAACLAAIWPVTKRLGPACGALVAVLLLPPLAAGGVISIGRITSVGFPVFIWLAGAIPARSRAAWVAAFAVLQGWGASLFFTLRGFI